MTRATDIPIEARAFLDALAVGESGGADDDAAYSVLFGGSHFPVPHTPNPVIPSDPNRGNPSSNGWPLFFPAWPGKWINGVPTHAAGRYQFEPATWRDLQARLKLPNFSPVSQDHAAWELADIEYRRNGGPLLNLLKEEATPAQLADVAEMLHPTWTSLNPDSFPSRYQEALKRYVTSPS